jgi:hypothetical protein
MQSLFNTSRPEKDTPTTLLAGLFIFGCNNDPIKKITLDLT